MFAERPYHWQDRIIIIDESKVDTSGRRERNLKSSSKFTKFRNKEINNWVLMDPKIHKKCLKNYSEHIKHNREFILMNIISG